MNSVIKQTTMPSVLAAVYGATVVLSALMATVMADKILEPTLNSQPLGSNKYIVSIGVDSSGNIRATGSDFYTMFDKNGQQQWTKSVPGLTGSHMFWSGNGKAITFKPPSQSSLDYERWTFDANGNRDNVYGPRSIYDLGSLYSSANCYAKPQRLHCAKTFGNNGFALYTVNMTTTNTTMFVNETSYGHRSGLVDVDDSGNWAMYYAYAVNSKVRIAVVMYNANGSLRWHRVISLANANVLRGYVCKIDGNKVIVSAKTNGQLAPGAPSPTTSHGATVLIQLNAADGTTLKIVQVDSPSSNDLVPTQWLASGKIFGYLQGASTFRMVHVNYTLDVVNQTKSVYMLAMPSSQVDAVFDQPGSPSVTTGNFKISALGQTQGVYALNKPPAKMRILTMGESGADPTPTPTPSPTSTTSPTTSDSGMNARPNMWLHCTGMMMMLFVLMNA